MNHLELLAPRVKLVIPDSASAARARDYFLRNHDHLTPTTSTRPPSFYELEFWEQRLADGVEQFQEDQAVRLFMQEPQDDSQFIGVINFTQIFRGPFQACYLGYSISKSHEGRGLMFEALDRAIKYVFEERHLHRIMANHLPENQRSATVLKRLGFRTDGSSPEYLYINGSWQTHVMTSLTNPSWTPRDEDRDLFL
jgi:ribosomal-protein-alanine N-acetyltransferase